MTTKTKVIARLKVEGIHRWEECPIEEVSYLKKDHRHQFHITATVTVGHDDRDVEFIELSHKIKHYFHNTYYRATNQCCYFGTMSCEMIAKDLVKIFKLDSCEVNEDGESGAIVTTVLETLL